MVKTETANEVATSKAAAKKKVATKATAKKEAAKAGDGTVTVRLVKGLRGSKSIHRLSVKALGLGKLNSTRVLKDSPQVRGLINTVHYLVRVEE